MKRIINKIILILGFICVLIVSPALFYFKYENASITIILFVIFINILVLLTNNIRVRYFLMKNKKAIIYADVRNSKLIKLFYGKDMSRKLINGVRDIIDSSIGNTGFSYKINNDHFIILINYYNKNEIISLINKINEQSRELLKDKDVSLYLSFGIHVCDDEGYESNENKASLACNYAKTRTIDIYSFYDSDDIEIELKEKKILDNLVNSLKNNEFEVYFQPKYNYRLKKIVGSEALVRLVHDNEIVPAKEFIEVAEKYNFTILLDKFVLKEVCKKINELKKDNIDFNVISINVSRNTLSDNNMLDYYSNVLKQYNIKKSEVEFEVTERDSNVNGTLLNETIHELSKRFNVSLDDFGVGNSSLAMLSEDKINTIKIDRKFITDESVSGRKILNNIIKLTHDLGFNIVAEGVETEKQYRYLKSKGCDVIQGYYYSKPLSFDDYKNLLKEDK